MCTLLFHYSLCFFIFKDLVSCNCHKIWQHWTLSWRNSQWLLFWRITKCAMLMFSLQLCSPSGREETAADSSSSADKKTLYAFKGLSLAADWKGALYWTLFKYADPTWGEALNLPRMPTEGRLRADSETTTPRRWGRTFRPSTISEAAILLPPEKLRAGRGAEQLLCPLWVQTSPHLTLSDDGIPLEKLLHHNLLTLTGNLKTQRQLYIQFSRLPSLSCTFGKRKCMHACISERVKKKNLYKG